MSPSSALRAAAEIVDRDRWRSSCDALLKVVQGEQYVSILLLYRDLLRPANAMDTGYWWGHPLSCSERNHNARVLGLLFAAEALE